MSYGALSRWFCTGGNHREVKAASVGAVGNPSLSCTSRALHRIDFVSCQHRLLHRGEARSVAGRASMLFDLRRHDEAFRLPQFAASFLCPPKEMASVRVAHQDHFGCERSACSTRYKTIMSVRPRCAILLTFLNSNREWSNTAGVLSEPRASTLGDITIRIDERHVSNFAQYPRGSGLSIEPRGGADAGLSPHDDAK